MISLSFLRGLNWQQLSPKTAKNKKPWLKTTKAKQVFSFSRWLHIYISSALFTLLLFFCITGITLNHADWTGASSSSIETFKLPHVVAVKIDDEYQLTKIQRFLETKTGLSSPRSIDVALDLGEITYDYPLPAGYAFITVFIEENVVEVEQSKGSLLALVNDLHKGRYSGKAWSWLIDVSALLMSLFTLTGIIILFQNAKHRRKASFILLVGALTPLFIYFFAVPRLLS